MANNSGNCTEIVENLYSEALEHQTWVRVIFVLLTVPIFLLGILGNGAVAAITLSNQRLQTVQNMFIVNLAIAELAVTMLSTPFTVTQMLYKAWFFGTIWCKSISWVTGITTVVTCLSLTVIAIDRHTKICHPHKSGSLFTTRVNRILITVIWLMAMAITCPYAYFIKLGHYPVEIDENGTITAYSCAQFCQDTWPNRELKTYFTICLFVVQLAAPVTVMAYCYGSIFVTLEHRQRKKLRNLKLRGKILENSIAHGTSSLQQSGMVKRSSMPSSDYNIVGEETVTSTKMSLAESELTTQQTKHRDMIRTHRRQTRRTNILLTTMVLFYVLTYLPYNMLMMWLDFDDDIETHFTWGNHRYFYVTCLVFYLFMALNTVANPVLYALINPVFSDSLCERLPACVKGTCRAGGSRPASRFNRSHTLQSDNCKQVASGSGGDAALRARGCTVSGSRRSSAAPAVMTSYRVSRDSEPTLLPAAASATLVHTNRRHRTEVNLLKRPAGGNNCVMPPPAGDDAWRQHKVLMVADTDGQRCDDDDGAEHVPLAACNTCTLETPKDDELRRLYSA